MFVADVIAMTGGEHALLAADLSGPPYERARAPVTPAYPQIINAITSSAGPLRAKEL